MVIRSSYVWNPKGRDWCVVGAFFADISHRVRFKRKKYLEEKKIRKEKSLYIIDFQSYPVLFNHD